MRAPTQQRASNPVYACAALCLAGSVILAGCGAVGEPLYPALNIPMRVTDLVAVERGGKIDVRFSVPPLTTEGLAVKQLGSVDLRVGPNVGSEFHVEQWSPQATRFHVDTPEKPGPVHVDVPAQEFIGKQVIVAVRLGNVRGRMSEWSNLIVVTVEPPLATPSAFLAEPVADGVRLSWTAPTPGSFRIFRKVGEDQPALLATVDTTEYVDHTTDYGRTYQYYVEGVHQKTESELASAKPITPVDTFAPKVPVGLTASAGLNAVELAWERNVEPDLKEYRVYRADQSGAFVKIAEGIEGPSYSDKKVESGKHYRYRITAVDQTGNESEQSPPVEIVAP